MQFECFHMSETISHNTSICARPSEFIQYRITAQTGLILGLLF